jgi:hypothetical protein
VVPRTLKDKVFNDVGYVPEVVYYDTGGYSDFTWPFGGQGNLFKYLYRDSSIIEIAVVHGKVLASDQDLCASTLGKRYLSFQFNAETCRGELSTSSLVSNDLSAIPATSNIDEMQRGSAGRTPVARPLCRFAPI